MHKKLGLVSDSNLKVFFSFQCDSRKFFIHFFNAPMSHIMYGLFSKRSVTILNCLASMIKIVVRAN
ncbi:hypothetical protein MCN98_08505 [Flavobacteriaceae bacterium LSUCC0859]|nr:hypothetical protein [Flavobacteriaceae bacterium LSUCC0859]